MVARLGGDEFVLMLPETPPHAAQVVLPKLRRRLAEVAAMNKWPISYSIGAVTFMDPVVTPDEAVKLADDLMYAVKHNGKDRVSHQIVEDPDWEERLVRNRLRRSG